MASTACLNSSGEPPEPIGRSLLVRLRHTSLIAWVLSMSLYARKPTQSSCGQVGGGINLDSLLQQLTQPASAVDMCVAVHGGGRVHSPFQSAWPTIRRTADRNLIDEIRRPSRVVREQFHERPREADLQPEQVTFCGQPGDRVGICVGGDSPYALPPRGSAL